MQTIFSKKQLRQDYLSQRSLIAPEVHAKKCQEVCANIVSFIANKSYAYIFLFSAIRGEPDIFSIMKSGNSSLGFALPVVSQDRQQMQFAKWDGQTGLTPGQYGISQPDSLRFVEPGSDTLILVPALAVDRKGNRLGYGGGYYDRYLMRYSQATSAAIVFDEFVSESLPTEKYDHPVNLIITNKKIEIV